MIADHPTRFERPRLYKKALPRIRKNLGKLRVCEDKGCQKTVLCQPRQHLFLTLSSHKNMRRRVHNHSAIVLRGNMQTRMVVTQFCYTKLAHPGSIGIIVSGQIIIFIIAVTGVIAIAIATISRSPIDASFTQPVQEMTHLEHGVCLSWRIVIGKRPHLKKSPLLRRLLGRDHRKILLTTQTQATIGASPC